MRKETIEIIYQDNDIFVINKPAGVPVTKDRSGKPQLIDFLAEQIGDAQTAQLRLIHRLDKDTSGVMILARNRPAQRKLADYFFDRTIKKNYLALVKGAVIENQGVIDSPIGHSKKHPERKVIDIRHGKPSTTEWRLLANFGLCSLLAVSPLTGRTHQIRIHLASVGLPLAIDPLYAGNSPLMLSEFKKDYRLGKFQEEKPLIDRLTLHAYQIVIPESFVIASEAKQSPCFVAPLDKKFKATVKMLAKHNPKGPAAFINSEDFEKILNSRPLV
ncbi:MAG: RluA family pseudouridine synthase [Sedimentisphaerales bacterium]|nr:RluA family pseudouridine synthase [Sedimentisphaerales bacterium]